MMAPLLRLKQLLSLFKLAGFLFLLTTNFEGIALSDSSQGEFRLESGFSGGMTYSNSGDREGSVMIQKSADSLLFLTGGAAENFATQLGGSGTGAIAPPAQRRMIELRGENGNVNGGFSELLPGSGIFITARHVLQQQREVLLENSLRYNDIDLAKLHLYEFLDRKTGLPLDVIVAIPEGKESEVLEPTNFQMACNNGTTWLALKTLSVFRGQVRTNDLYYSYQFGTVGSHDDRQVSRGQISRISNGAGFGMERFYLDVDSRNHTTVRSSGSIVETLPLAEVDRKSSVLPWKIGGIVECAIAGRRTRSGVEIPEAIQVIPLSKLLDEAVVRKIPLGKLAREKYSQDTDCKPIDGRDAGGTRNPWPL